MPRFHRTGNAPPKPAGHRARCVGMVELLVYLAVLVIVVVLIWWLLQQLPLPEPAQKIIQIAVVVLVAVVVIALLLQATGVSGSLPRLR